MLKALAPRAELNPQKFTNMKALTPLNPKPLNRPGGLGVLVLGPSPIERAKQL